jgi:hypothetical protein
MTKELMIVDNFFSERECAAAIEEIEHYIAAGFGTKYGENSAPSHPDRSDVQIYADDPGLPKLESVDHMNTLFWQTFRPRYEEHALQAYLSTFPILQEVHLSSYQCKLQRTEPSGGFHRWHYEAFDAAHTHRVITWSLFLNDGFGGGETEFLYMQKRVEPKAGRLAMFPCHWGATHRGNPPLTGAKYLATGWTVNTGYPPM